MNTPYRLTRRHLLKLGSVAASAALLSGCGFRLRRADSIPTLPPLSIEGATATPLAQELENRLSRQGTVVAPGAPWQVTLGTPAVDNRPLGSDGRASREHELTMSVSVSVQQRETGAYALNNAVITTSTRIRVNDDDLLNRETLFEEANQTLTHQLVRRIIERLGTLEAPP
ncbi:LPS-assembly lipoprotein LptE [Vreelandella sp. EE22]